MLSVKILVARRYFDRAPSGRFSGRRRDADPGCEGGSASEFLRGVLARRRQRPRRSSAREIRLIPLLRESRFPHPWLSPVKCLIRFSPPSVARTSRRYVSRRWSARAGLADVGAKPSANDIRK